MNVMPCDVPGSIVNIIDVIDEVDNVDYVENIDNADDVAKIDKVVSTLLASFLTEDTDLLTITSKYNFGRKKKIKLVR